MLFILWGLLQITKRIMEKENQKAAPISLITGNLESFAPLIKKMASL